MTDRRSVVCWDNAAQKRTRWPRVVIPHIIERFAQAVGMADAPGKSRETAFIDAVTFFAEWLNFVDLRPYTSPRLRYGDREAAERLHELVRRGRYVYYLEACDRINPPEQTIVGGGDCDQWAVVIATAAYLLGFPAVYLVTAGDNIDPYQHVYTEVHGTSGAWILDPKGDDNGESFNETRPAPLVQRYRIYQADDRPKGRI